MYSMHRNLHLVVISTPLMCVTTLPTGRLGGRAHYILVNNDGFRRLFNVAGIECFKIHDHLVWVMSGQNLTMAGQI